MGVLHIVRCNGPACCREERMNAVVAQSVMRDGGPWPSVAYRIPTKWHQVDRLTFCSWACLTAYGKGQFDDEVESFMTKGLSDRVIA